MIADLQGKIIYADPAMGRMLGMNPGKMIEQAVELEGRFQFQGGLAFKDIAQTSAKEGQWAGEGAGLVERRSGPEQGAGRRIGSEADRGTIDRAW